MSAKPRSHREILTLLGGRLRATGRDKAGRALLARELGRDYQTVNAWVLRDSIPFWEWPAIAILARSKGLRISEALLRATMRRDFGKGRIKRVNGSGATAAP